MTHPTPSTPPGSNAKGAWWCADCKEIVLPAHVTHSEHHDERCGGCGFEVQWMENSPSNPTSVLPPGSNVARRITADCQPVFPCWCFDPRPSVGWWHCESATEFEFANQAGEDTHWHPDAPTAPTCRPEDKAQVLEDIVCLRHTPATSLPPESKGEQRTPRTDAEVQRIFEVIPVGQDGQRMGLIADFARQLERELAVAIEAGNESWRKYDQVRFWHEEQQRVRKELEDQLAKLERETARLVEELNDAKEMVGKTVEQLFNENQQLRAQLATLQRRAEGDRADRERIDWLQATKQDLLFNPNVPQWIIGNTYTRIGMGTDDIRSAIDAARALAQRGPEGEKL